MNGPGLDRTPEQSIAAEPLAAVVEARSGWLAATITRLHHLPFVTGVWLVGSLGRLTSDAYSDIDLVVAVDPATSPPALLVDPVDGLQLPGRVLFTRPKPRNAPAGGGYLAVCVELAGLPVLVDVYLWPSPTAAVPAGARVLDAARAGTAGSDLDFMALLDRHRTTDTTGADPQTPATTLMLVQLAAKYLARGDRARLAGVAGQLRLSAPVDAPALQMVLHERVDLDAHPDLRPAVNAVQRLLAVAERTGEVDIVLRARRADVGGARDEPARRWLRPLPGGRNNHVYAWHDPHAEPCCVKLYRVDDRRRADREWAALRLLAEHRFPGAPRPLWIEPGNRPVIGMTLLPGTPLPDTDDPLSALAGLAGLAKLTAQLQQVPLSGLLAELDRIDDLEHYLRRISQVWPRQLAEQPDDPLTEAMRSLLQRWTASGDREILARPDRVVLSRGDANLGNWLVADRVGCVDFEFAGHSTPSFDAADHLEHISAAAITDQQWQPLLPLLGVTDTNHDRFRAARRVCALRWLAILWRQRDQRAAEFHRQHARVLRLLTQPGN